MKVQTDHYEVNIWLTESEVNELQSNDPGEWCSRGALRVGKCAESSVYWNIHGDFLSIIIGHDEESWSISFSLPVAALAQIRQALGELAPWLSGLSLPSGYAGHVPDHYTHIYRIKNRGEHASDGNSG